MLENLSTRLYHARVSGGGSQQAGSGDAILGDHEESFSATHSTGFIDDRKWPELFSHRICW